MNAVLTHPEDPAPEGAVVWSHPEIPSPLPWRVGGLSGNPGEAESLVDATGAIVAWTSNTALDELGTDPAIPNATPNEAGEVVTPEDRANARRIVLAVNHYPAFRDLAELVVQRLSERDVATLKSQGLDELLARANAVLDSLVAR